MIGAPISARDRLRRRAQGVAFELLVNLGLPARVYGLAQPSLGELRALMLSSAPPRLRGRVSFARRRPLDAIALLVPSPASSSPVALLMGGSAKRLLLGERLVTCAEPSLRNHGGARLLVGDRCARAAGSGVPDRRRRAYR